MEKLILTDCDGVLLHWEWMFDQWMRKHRYAKQKTGSYSIAECYGLTNTESARLISMFNETVYATKIPPYKDAIKYLTKLHNEYGVVLHVISSISSDPVITNSRIRNLEEVFPTSLFYKVTCLDPKASKGVALEEYEDSGLFWLEDHYGNYLLGEQLGLRSVLFTHHYNVNEKVTHRVNSWKEIYEMVTN